jgi:hypothetical protein
MRAYNDLRAVYNNAAFQETLRIEDNFGKMIKLSCACVIVRLGRSAHQRYNERQQLRD